jgi:hypothetical protein
MCVIARQCAAFSTVIVRFDRTIQHSRDCSDETDKSLLAMTGGGEGASDNAAAKICSAIVIWLTNHHRISWSGRATSGAGDALQDPSRIRGCYLNGLSKSVRCRIERRSG